MFSCFPNFLGFPGYTTAIESQIRGLFADRIPLDWNLLIQSNICLCLYICRCVLHDMPCFSIVEVMLIFHHWSEELQCWIVKRGPQPRTYTNRFHSLNVLVPERVFSVDFQYVDTFLFLFAKNWKCNIWSLEPVCCKLRELVKCSFAFCHPRNVSMLPTGEAAQLHIWKQTARSRMHRQAMPRDPSDQEPWGAASNL